MSLSSKNSPLIYDSPAILSAAGESLVLFLFFTGLSFFAIGLIGPNASALALQPLGHIAGAGVAANGFAGATVAGLLGGVIGRMYDSTTTPVVMGFLMSGMVSFAIILWTEKGVLFRPGEAGPEETP